MNGFVTHCGTCGRVTHLCACGNPPVMAPIAPPVMAPGRYALRYGVLICDVCGMAKDYCKGHAPADPPAKDGAESQLRQRIAEVVSKRAGGR